MNDLRSQNRTLAPVREIGPSTGEIVSNPSGRRSSSTGNPLFENSRPGERPAERKAGRTADADSLPLSTDVTAEGDTEDEALSFPVSRDLDSMPVSARDETAATKTETAHQSRDNGSHSAGNNGNGDHAEGEGDDVPRARTRRRRDLAAANDGPDTRPAKRREADDDDEPEDEEEKFSWSFKFEDDDEQPEELQAKSPLLSRAFRSSVG